MSDKPGTSSIHRSKHYICTLWTTLLERVCSQDVAANAPTIIFTHNTSSSLSASVRHDHATTEPAAQGFARKMSDGSVALVLLNREDRGSLTLAATWAQLGLDSTGTATAAASSCTVRDLINQRDLPKLERNSTFNSTVASHTASFVRITC